MSEIRREIEDGVREAFLNGNKAIIIKGPRQSGKTTLVNRIIRDVNESVLYFTGDDVSCIEMLDSMTIVRWKEILGSKKYVFIDEAQKIRNIGNSAKLLADHFSDVRLIMTGSSSFQLGNISGEALTGRKREWLLLPLSYSECAREYGTLAERRNLEERLVFGSYPEVVVGKDRREAVDEIAQSYLMRDVLSVDGIRKVHFFPTLIKALAMQVGSEVSLNELSSLTGANKETVARYVSILEQSYIIFSLMSYSTNKRSELKRARKIYFYDNGIRNSLIGDFTTFSMRSPDENGLLFENYIISERIKSLNNKRIRKASYFWRTTGQSEVDYIEEADGKIEAYEIKLNPKRKNSFSRAFMSSYPECRCEVVTTDNYAGFLG